MTKITMREIDDNNNFMQCVVCEDIREVKYCETCGVINGREYECKFGCEAINKNPNYCEDISDHAWKDISDHTMSITEGCSNDAICLVCFKERGLKTCPDCGDIEDSEWKCENGCKIEYLNGDESFTKCEDCVFNEILKESGVRFVHCEIAPNRGNSYCYKFIASKNLIRYKVAVKND